jgi:hypothetical protein
VAVVEQVRHPARVEQVEVVLLVLHRLTEPLEP